MTTRVRELTGEELTRFNYESLGLTGNVTGPPAMRILIVERVRPWFRRVGQLVFLTFTETGFGFGIGLMGGLSRKHAEVYGPQLLTWLKSHVRDGGVIRVMIDPYSIETDSFFRKYDFKFIRRVGSGAMEFMEYQWPPPMSRRGVQALARDLAGDLSVGTDEEDPIPELERKEANIEKRQTTNQKRNQP